MEEPLVVGRAQALTWGQGEQGDHLGAYYKIQLKDDGGWDQTAVEMVKCSQYLQSEATRELLGNLFKMQILEFPLWCSRNKSD